MLADWKLHADFAATDFVSLLGVGLIVYDSGVLNGKKVENLKCVEELVRTEVVK